MRALYRIPVWLFFIWQCNGKSIKPTKECGSNEYYDSCGGQDCEPTCQEPDRVCRSRACFGPAYCACKKGFYRNKDGECVSEDDCEYDNMEIITFPPETTKGPKNCGVHEYYDYCGNECEPTCEEPVKVRQPYETEEKTLTSLKVDASVCIQSN
ncbi:hypothetical protein Y032_0112g298 [Ancylostoma ceylanicum]|uniref:TIL domain-containing protein n=1 Tax=Ancylostoma ceylanicum TaxID=53326 RepID=A0A016TDT3_9BILA|nr:hypothetical protein Y032_0112g298 [Ancylostoma ceylanicum]